MSNIFYFAVFIQRYAQYSLEKSVVNGRANESDIFLKQSIR